MEYQIRSLKWRLQRSEMEKKVEAGRLKEELLDRKSELRRRNITMQSP